MDVLLLVRRCRRWRPRLSALAATLVIVVPLGTVAAPLDVLDWSNADSAAIVQWADTNGANQQFSLSDLDGGYVRLTNRHSNKLIRTGSDQTLPLSPCRLQFLYRGQDPNAAVTTFVCHGGWAC